MERMEEAFRTLARLPIATRPRGYVNSMPFYVYDRGDLNAQIETYELERMARLRNRVRIPPSPAEIARMEQALYWPAAYLGGAEFHHIARAVNLGSLWAAFDTDVDERLKPMKITRRAFNARKLQGLRNHRPRAGPLPRADPVNGNKSIASSAGHRQSKAQAALIAAYREGFGLAAIAVIGVATGVRIAALASGCDAALAPGETIEAQWWCRRASDAARVAAAATTRLRRGQSKHETSGSAAPGSALDLAGKAVVVAARQCGLMLYTDEEIVAAAMAAIARVDEEIERLQRAGELKSLNRSYKIYRTETTARGEMALPYAQWFNEYRANLVRQLAAALQFT